MAVTFTPIEGLIEELWKGTHDASSHTFKLALSNTLPDAAADLTLADITEIGTGNGYVAGGYTLSGFNLLRTGSVLRLDFVDPAVAASGGSIGPFQYCVVYNNSASNKLIGWFTLDAANTVADGTSPNLILATAGFLRTSIV